MTIERIRIKHIVAVVALISYVLVGAIGFWNTIDQFFQHGTQPWVINKGQAPLPSSSRVVWTQQKHYPSTARDDIQTPAVVSEGTYHYWQNFSTAAISEPLDAAAVGFSQQYTPRAPPKS